MNANPNPGVPRTPLRAWFAGQALVGLLAGPRPINNEPQLSPQAVADAAWLIADAMILREPPDPTPQPPKGRP